jgi:hypothetical protein
MINSLSVRISERKAEKHVGWSKTGRIYADFVVDGTPLSTFANRLAPEHISCLGWGSKESQDDVLSRLLPGTTAASDDRVPLYICPECGDLGCGAVTVKVEREGSNIVWRDFAFETGLDTDPPDLNRSTFADVGPFRFSANDYESAIRSGYGAGGFLGDAPLKRGIVHVFKKAFGIS